MKKLLTLLHLLLVFVAQAQEEKSLLWKVSGNGLEKPSYLYGTIHVICPEDYFMTAKTKKAFSETDELYLELDMSDPQVATQIQFQMLLMNGKTLKDYCSEEDFAMLDKYFRAHINTGMDVLQRMKPIALMSMSYMTILNCQPKSYETEFTTMAKAAEKPIVGFETVAEQMQIFDSIPYEEQMEALIGMIKDEETSKAEFKSMVSTYKDQDLSKMLEVMNDSEWNMEEFADMMINRRNRNWVATFENEAKESSLFVAVGAGHLGGEKGLLALLKAKGYTVEAVL